MGRRMFLEGKENQHILVPFYVPYGLGPYLKVLCVQVSCLGVLGGPNKVPGTELGSATYKHSIYTLYQLSSSCTVLLLLFL